MTQQITPELFNAWRLKNTLFKTAKVSFKSKQNIIEPFNINSRFSSQYLAVGIIVKDSKDSWQYGGKIAQEFKFPSYSTDYVKRGKAFNYSQELLINRVTFIQFPLITSKDYKVHYFPPKYFTEVKIQIWEYTGITTDILLENLVNKISELPAEDLINIPAIEESLNCIKSDLAEIKNYLGIFPPSEPIEENLFFLFN